MILYQNKDLVIGIYNYTWLRKDNFHFSLFEISWSKIKSCGISYFAIALLGFQLEIEKDTKC